MAISGINSLQPCAGFNRRWIDEGKWWWENEGGCQCKIYLWTVWFFHCEHSNVWHGGVSWGVSATSDSSVSFECLSKKTPGSNCPCNAYQSCQSQVERKNRAVFPLQRRHKMEQRWGRLMSPESYADGFISKFRNTGWGWGWGVLGVGMGRIPFKTL